MSSIFSAKVIALTRRSNGNGALITLQCEYPRFIHSEVMTHRVFSRNAMSNRAVPIDRMLRQIMENPAAPVSWGLNKPGMQAGAEADDTTRHQAMQIWLSARDAAVQHARALQNVGMHKQIVNRVIEPFQIMKLLVSATKWDNFFELRLSKLAQPEIQYLAHYMKRAIDEAMEKNTNPGKPGDWHLPYITPDELNLGMHVDLLAQVSAARCARVSYMNHDIDKDLALAEQLRTSGHWSPFEHQAIVQKNPLQDCRNFVGFHQFRAMIGG